MTAFSFLLWVLVILLPLLALAYAAFTLLSLPQRRQERARFFLELMEAELARGKNLEQTIVSLSASRDKSLGVRFHLLAAHIESGHRLWQALEKVPGFLPPQVTAILRHGERLGAVQKMLPVAQRTLEEGQLRLLSTFNYFVLVALALSPLAPAVFIFVTVSVTPKLREIFLGASGDAIPALPSLVLNSGLTFAAVQLFFTAILYAATILYIGGPRVVSMLKRVFGDLPDRVALCFPWKRRRLQRVFSAVLGSLLDNGVPEAQAVEIAAESTANNVFISSGRGVVQRLSRGEKLADALLALNKDREFSWRLSNASRGGIGFMAALSGWIDSLEAKAFQQEQAASQLITTGLVLLNGFMVGSLVIGLFTLLIHLTNGALLW